MGVYEDLLAEPRLRAAYVDSYRGRHDPLDAAWWTDHPFEPGLTGAQSPATGRAELERAAFSRNGGLEAELALADFDRELEADRAATLSALKNARQSLIRPFIIERPQRSRKVFLGAASAAVIVAAVLIARLVLVPAGPDAATTPEALPPSTPAVPTATATPTMPRYFGPASCTSLLDPNTVSMFGNISYREYSAEIYASNAGDSDWPIAPFLKLGGLFCAWGPDVDHIEVLYAYSPIESNDVMDQEADITSRGFIGLSLDDETGIYQVGTEGYAIGDGFWAYADSDRPEILSALIAHAPENSNRERTDLQADVYASSEGVGDLRIGKPVKTSSTLTFWNDNACAPGVGAWNASGQFQSDGSSRTFEIVTDDGTRAGDISVIRIFTPAIPTKSGVRVGDSVDRMNEVLDGLALKPSNSGDSYSVEGTSGTITFQVGALGENDPRVVLAIVVSSAGTGAPPLGSDASGPCGA
jgi:hypothetical protein